MMSKLDHSGSAAIASTSPSFGIAAVYVRTVLIAALLLVAFWPIITGMYASWFDDRSYMEHGILVIPAACYMGWTKRQQLARIRPEPSIWGLVLLGWAAAQATLSVVLFWPWVGRTAFLMALVGCILATYGARMVNELKYPLCTLILMIAPPSFIYDRLTLSLQLLASRLGETFLEALGYSVMREGNILELVGIKLSVEEACSGIRSLFSILFMCTLYNFFFVRGNFTKTLILVMAVPIAILGNAGRILATGIASQYNRELIQGVSHETFGYISVIVAGIGCISLHMFILWVQKIWRIRHA
jgi:exosortase